MAALRQEAGRFRLVVTDLQLPIVDGLEVLRTAREVNPTCFVVIVTGYASLDSAIQAVRLGAYDYLTKPFSLGQLDVLLGRVQDRLTLEEENRRLLRQLGERDAADGRQPLLARLDALEPARPHRDAPQGRHLRRPCPPESLRKLTRPRLKCRSADESIERRGGRL